MPEPIPDVSARDRDLAQRRTLMFATLGFNELVRVPPGMGASFRALRSWLNSWRGIGPRQGYDLYLCWYDGRGWRATFYVTGMEHSMVATGS